MSALTARDVLRFCFWEAWHRSVVWRVAVLVAWCSALAVLSFNASFRWLFEDGNLLIRGVCTLVLGAPLIGLYVLGRRALGAELDSRGVRA